MFFHAVNCLEACIWVFSLDDLEVFEIISTLYEQSMFFLLFHLLYQLRIPRSVPVKYHFFSFLHVSTGITQTKAKTKCTLLKVLFTKSTAASCLGGGKTVCWSLPHTAQRCTHRLLFQGASSLTSKWASWWELMQIQQDHNLSAKTALNEVLCMN